MHLVCFALNSIQAFLRPWKRSKHFFDGKYFHKIWYFLNFFKSKERSCIYLLKFFRSFRQRVTFDFCESISAGYTVHTSSFSEDTSGFFQAILPLKGSICLPGLTTCRNHLENVKWKYNKFVMQHMFLSFRRHEI